MLKRDKDLLERLTNKYGKRFLLKEMKGANIEFKFRDFYELLSKFLYEYDDPEWLNDAGKLKIKDIFNKEYIRCESIRKEPGMRKKIGGFTYAYKITCYYDHYEDLNVIEVICKNGPYMYEYISSTDALIEFFGIDNLMVIYNFLKERMGE